MINRQLLDPESIVIIGASNDTSKPGGKVLHNIVSNGFPGKIFAVNPKENEVQGIPCYADCAGVPDVDLAIIAIAADKIEAAMNVLAFQKNCKAFILFSSGFSETGQAGKDLEDRCKKIVDTVGGCLIGPNCIGVITGKYKGVFAGPIPEFDPAGCDCVSASGATMVYLLESAIPRGLKFRDIFSVGNSAQVGIEDVLQYWDETFDAKESARTKLLYMEQISDPARLLKHARSLVLKGCNIAAIKSGNTDAGARAVSSHTGSLAGSNDAVSALFRKAGIIRCYSRVELVYVAGIFSIKPLTGNRIAVITHAGGPGVMLTDILIKGGMKVPHLAGAKADTLLAKLNPGSSVANPIDFLATGTAAQLGEILDTVDRDFDEIDGAVVVFGTTGMWRVDDAYLVLHDKMASCRKPIFPILPSVIQAAEEVSRFHAMGHVNFSDEVSFGYVLTRVNRQNAPYPEASGISIDASKVREIINRSAPGFLKDKDVFELLSAAGIPTAKQAVVDTQQQAADQSIVLGFPLVMKVSGPLHKSDVGGVALNIGDVEAVKETFDRLMKIEGATAVIMQQQSSGIEIYIGAKKEPPFGHLVLCGLGGIFVEIFKDVSYGLVPLGKEEATSMVMRLKSLPVIQGARGREGVDAGLIVDVMLRLSALLEIAPEITELDINPLLGKGDKLIAVDARISVG
jgi:acetate---CoA ligase (ADP-forming)